MNEPLLVEEATLEDVKDLASLREHQGWYRNTELLRAVLAWEHARIFMLRKAPSRASQAGVPRALLAVASATATGALGVVGNVIVRTEYRGMGYGRRILEHTLAWQRAQGVRSVLLDATEAGRPLYLRLGFVAQEPSWHATATLASLEARARTQDAHGVTARLVPASALADLSRLDAAAYGGDRMPLLAGLLTRPDCWLYLAEEHGAPVGYALLRLLEGFPPLRRPVLRLGPLVATADHAAVALFTAMTAPNAPWGAHPAMAPDTSISLSPPHDHPSAARLLERSGFALSPDDLVMRLDLTPREAGDSLAEHPEWLYAWLAPMTF